MLVARYSPSSVKLAISKIAALIHSAEELRKVPRILAEAGPARTMSSRVVRKASAILRGANKPLSEYWAKPMAQPLMPTELT